MTPWSWSCSFSNYCRGLHRKSISGHAELIVMFCLMKFSRSGGQQLLCSGQLYTELQWCFYKQSSVAESPCVHPVPTDLPQLRLWLIFWVRMNKDSSLEDRYYFYTLALKWAWVLGIKHSEESFVPVAILCLVIQWEMQTVLLREVVLNSPWSYESSHLLASQHLSQLQMTTQNRCFEKFRLF